GRLSMTVVTGSFFSIVIGMTAPPVDRYCERSARQRSLAVLTRRQSLPPVVLVSSGIGVYDPTRKTVPKSSLEVQYETIGSAVSAFARWSDHSDSRKTTPTNPAAAAGNSESQRQPVRNRQPRWKHRSIHYGKRSRRRGY